MLKKKEVYKLISFNGHDISTGMIMLYMAYLYKVYNIRDLYYDYINCDGALRFYIGCVGCPLTIVHFYFIDRCPAMVEKEIKEIWDEYKDKIVYTTTTIKVNNIEYSTIASVSNKEPEIESTSVLKNGLDNRLYTKEEIIKLLIWSIKDTNTDIRTMRIGLHREDPSLKVQITIAKSIANELGVDSGIIDEMLKYSYVD